MLTRGLHAIGVGLVLALLAGFTAAGRVSAQSDVAKGEAAKQKVAVAGTAASPLGRFVPKENLLLYVEFAGLNAAESSWKNTAAQRMLSETQLGGMMEEVTAQLLDKTLSLSPNKRLSGSELFSLVKHSLQTGWALAIHADPKNSASPLRGTLIVRGGATKEFRALSARTMGWMMGDAKPKIDRKEGRTMVVVPAAAAPGSPAGATGDGWAWWAEKDDLAIGFPSPTGADAIIAALDGKTPTVLEDAQVQALSKPEGGFQPVCVVYAATANCPALPSRLTELLHMMGTEWGVQRVDARLGFDGDALVTVSRFTAAKPRKGALAIFDQPTFEKSAILPLPSGVDSFAALSLNPAHLLEALYAADASDTVKGYVDDLAKAIRRGGKIDIEKDLFAHLGPKMILFLGPERSAATNDETSESALKKGFNLLALTSALQSVLPKLTMVVEVDNPDTFGKALNAVVIAANHALKARAHEIAEEERAAGGEQPEGGARAPAPGPRPGAAGARTKRRRSPEETPAPQFTPVLGQEDAFVLTTPRDSAFKLGPSHFRPTIQLEGKYLVVSTSSDAVRAAITAIKQKNWKPSSEVQKAWEAVPNRLIALLVNDVRDGLSSVLASWPGTLQATINTSIALSRPRAEPDPAAKPPQGQPGRAGGLAVGGPRRGGAMGAAGVLGRAGLAGGGAAADGERGARGGPGGGPAGANGPGNGPGTSGESKSSGDDNVQLKVDADKLPKADDLKKLLSPSVAFISLSDEEVRFTTRTAFPNLGLPIELAPLLASTPLGQRIREALAPAQSQASNSEQSSATNAGASAGPATAPPGGQTGSAPPNSPGRGRGRRRDD
jgi:hypothetical protein